MRESELPTNGMHRPRGIADAGQREPQELRGVLAALADVARLDLLARTGLVEASAESRLPTLDYVARLAARATQSPIAQVNLLSADAQLPAAAFVHDGGVGGDGSVLSSAAADLGGAWRVGVPLERSICQFVVAGAAPLIIPDTGASANSAVQRIGAAAGVRAYAAAPLVTPSGHVLGSVCVVDFKPRQWSTDDIATLEACGALAGAEVAMRLEAARKLEEANSTLDTILEHIPEGIVVAAAPDVMITRVSRYGRDLAGRSLSELAGVPSALHPDRWDLYHPDGERRPTAAELPLTRATLHGEIVRDEEWVLRRPDGGRITILCNAAPIRDSAGRITGGLIAYRDIEERKARETVLQRLVSLGDALAGATTVAEVAQTLVAEVRDAFHADGTAVARLDPDDPRYFVSLATTGFPEAQIRNGWSRFGADVPAPSRDVLRTGTPVHVPDLDVMRARYPAVVPIAEACGYPSWLTLPCAVGSGADRRVIAVIALAFRDAHVLTPYEELLAASVGQQAAQALERARLFDAERAAREALETAWRDAEDANRAKGEFLANMSHELRTPLNAITGHVQLIELGLHGLITEPQRVALARVQIAGRHLLGLINDVLNFAKLEAGKVQYALESVDLREVLTSTSELIEPLRTAKGLTFTVHVPPTECLVWADRDKLAQVLLNLLTNAVKFTAEGGRVEVRVVTPSLAPNEVVLEVADTGTGIPADRLEEIFEPFVQVHRASVPAREGTGLGLTISRDLARGMQGELTVESAVGVGSVFRLRLRCAEGGGVGRGSSG